MKFTVLFSGLTIVFATAAPAGAGPLLTLTSSEYAAVADASAYSSGSPNLEPSIGTDASVEGSGPGNRDDSSDVSSPFGEATAQTSGRATVTDASLSFDASASAYVMAQFDGIVDPTTLANVGATFRLSHSAKLTVSGGAGGGGGVAFFGLYNVDTDQNYFSYTHGVSDATLGVPAGNYSASAAINTSFFAFVGPGGTGDCSADAHFDIDAVALPVPEAPPSALAGSVALAGGFAAWRSRRRFVRLSAHALAVL